MFRSAIISLTAASSMTYGATEAFDSISKTTQSSVAVYAAAGDILSLDYETASTAEARMYKAAEGLQPIVDQYTSGKVQAIYAQYGH